MRIPTLSLILAALLAAPAASAQFTGLVTPPPRPAPPVELVASGGDVSADTTAARRMTDMKAWVDSAAVAVAAQAPQDTATPPVVIETPAVVAEPAPEQAPAFREGAPAPDTATVLPALILLGAGLIAGGAALRRR
ncbi:MAG TPA: hypothetical protein VFU01_02315 [Gemmatimonadaceae bacterium]|nr:hypothetical protein [Gemmatimonadaceae bacterium]